MVNHCANPQCSKPLHYLREGQIFAFNVPDPSAPQGSTGYSSLHVEHFWLCGDCSMTMQLTRTSGNDIRLLPRATKRASKSALPLTPAALAS
jgi:hypothetical protein